MSRKYKLQDLYSWGHIRDYEAKKLEQLNFTDVYYSDRMATIKNVDTDCNYIFLTDKSRSGYMSYALATKKPYNEIFPNKNKYCRSLWQCIKEYERLNGKEGN